VRLYPRIVIPYYANAMSMDRKFDRNHQIELRQNRELHARTAGSDYFSNQIVSSHQKKLCSWLRKESIINLLQRFIRFECSEWRPGAVRFDLFLCSCVRCLGDIDRTTKSLAWSTGPVKPEFVRWLIWVKRFGRTAWRRATSSRNRFCETTRPH